MKRVRKYTYLPQEEIEVIETKSGQTIKSKEILDGNYVKAKPAPKKVVKKAVKKVVKKYAKGGKVKLIFHGSSKEIDMGEFESAAAAKRYVESSDWKRPYSIKKMEDGGMLAKGGKLFPLMSEKEVFFDKAYSDKEVLELLDEDFSGKLSKEQIELIENSGFEYDDDKEGWYAIKSYKMAKGGKLVGNQKKLDVNKNGKLDAEDFKMLRGEKMAKGGKVDFDKVKTKYATQDINLLQKEGGMAITDTKKGVLFGEHKGGVFSFTTKDGKNIFSGNKQEAIEFVKDNYQVEQMADGGEVDRERMYNFLKDDLVALEMAIFMDEQVAGREEKYKEEIDKFFSYWNTHLKSLKRPDDAVGSNRMWNFLKDDLIALEAATKELPSSKQEIERFFSYWNTHLKSLSDEDLMNLKTYKKGSNLEIVKDWELKSNGRYYATFFLRKDDPRYRLITEHGVTESIEDVNGGYELTISVTKEGKDFFENYEGLDANGNPYTFKTMAKGGKTPIVRTQFEEEEFEYAKGGYMAKGGSIPKNSKYLDIVDRFNGLKIPEKVYLNGKEYKGEVSVINGYNGYTSTPQDGLLGVFDEVSGNVWNGFKGYLKDKDGKYLRAQDRRGLTINVYGDGGMMMTEIMRNVTHYDVTITAQPKTDSRNWANFVTFDTRVQTKDRQEAIRKAKLEFYAMYPNEKIMKIIAEPDTSAYIPDMPVAYGFADGGNVTDKEVAESNVHMLQSNIKSIKHHAEELEHAIKDNTEVEGWVLAKADRAATAMSDITHYIDGRKLGTGGMVGGIYYKDKTGQELRFIGPDSRNDDMGIFKDGEKYVTKPLSDFAVEKEKKSFWFGNGGFMPSGFSRKVTLSEKAEEMVGKNTWHMLDAAQKGEVIGELISDGALAVTMDRGGIIDANDWSKSMTQDKIYALKKAGYSENIASEMSLLPYEQLPMWVRQDFKKGSIVIGAYHIHKNDNIPVDGKVLVLNGDEEVVYSAETLDQAQEWATEQVRLDKEDSQDYEMVSDCCGAPQGQITDLCPECREHCGWEKMYYADGGVTEATKFKVVYKLRDAAEPKEKLFDNAEKAEFFLETIKDDDDIMSANLVEVKPMKKAAEKKAPTNLFAAAKPAAPSASKKTKEDVLVPGIADKIARYDALKAIIKNAEAEKEVIGGSLKEVGKEKFLELYELRRRNPDTFYLVDEDEKIMFYVIDRYIKVEPEKAGMLENYPGLLETTTTYKFNPALLDRTGEIISRLIMESTELSDDEKANLIVAETKIGIKTGSIDRLLDYDNPAQIFDLIEPIMALK